MHTPDRNGVHNGLGNSKGQKNTSLYKVLYNSLYRTYYKYLSPVLCCFAVHFKLRLAMVKCLLSSRQKTLIMEAAA